MKEGTELRAIYFAGDDEGEMRIGKANVTRLVVSSVNGQGAPVPWVDVYLHGVMSSRFNCAMLLGVEVLPEEGTNES